MFLRSSRVERCLYCFNPTSQSSITVFATACSNKTTYIHKAYQYSARSQHQFTKLKQQNRELQSSTTRIVQKIEHLDGRRQLFSEWLEFVVTSRSESRQLIDEIAQLRNRFSTVSQFSSFNSALRAELDEQLFHATLGNWETGKLGNCRKPVAQFSGFIYQLTGFGAWHHDKF